MFTDVYLHQHWQNCFAIQMVFTYTNSGGDFVST